MSRADAVRLCSRCGYTIFIHCRDLHSEPLLRISGGAGLPRHYSHVGNLSMFDTSHRTTYIGFESALRKSAQGIKLLYILCSSAMSGIWIHSTATDIPSVLPPGLGTGVQR